MSFRLFHWVPEFGHRERVYINREFTQDLDLFFEANENPDTRPKLFGLVNRDYYPEPYASEDDPLQALVEDALVEDALLENGIDLDDFTWFDLVEAAQ